MDDTTNDDALAALRELYRHIYGGDDFRLDKDGNAAELADAIKNAYDEVESDRDDFEAEVDKHENRRLEADFNGMPEPEEMFDLLNQLCLSPYIKNYSLSDINDIRAALSQCGQLRETW